MVTGANKGIGKEIARLLAADGATIYVGSRDAERGRRAVAEIGGDARLLEIDVTDEASVTAAAKQVEVLDILVNNSAGFAACRSSKTALNMLTILYAKALAADGVKVNALAPGLRKTGLNARAAASGGDPAEAAAGAVRLALLADDGPTGGFFSWDGSTVPW
jgi:NAD(P)-dependent dehydrogenase (short-subunit alcohol dehydrogenase family)